MPRRNKIALIGAGNIGGELARLCARKRARRRRAVRHPREGGLSQGQGARPRAERRRRSATTRSVTGTSNWADCAGADVVIVTAGVPRKPGMSRDDLLAINLKIIRNVAENLKKHCPDAFVIVISNPLDAMVYELKTRHRLPARARSSAWPACSTRARFQLFLRARLGRLGQGRARDGARRPRRRHGAGASATAPSTACRSTQLIAEGQARRDRRAHPQGRRRDRQADGHQRLLRAGVGARSRWPRPTCTTRSASCPCAAYLDGEYGYKDLYMGVPVVIGAGGVEKIVEHRADRRREGDARQVGRGGSRSSSKPSKKL